MEFLQERKQYFLFSPHHPTLQVDHSSILSVLSEEFVVGALLENLSLLSEDEDIVGFFDSLEAVGDDDDGLALEEFAERFGDVDLGEGIERAGRFVEDEDLGVAEEYPGDGETLAFSSGESDSLLSDERIESVWESVQEITFRVCECDQEILIGRDIGYPEDHIFTNRPVENGGLLREVPNVWEIRIESESKEILSIDVHLSLGWFEESEEDLHNRTLPCSTPPDQSDFLPSLETRGEMFHCIHRALRVHITHILEYDIAFPRLEYVPIMQSLHILKTIEKIPKSRNIRIVLGECLILIEDALEKLIHNSENETECYDIPGARGTASDIVPDKDNNNDPKNFQNIPSSPKYPDDFPLYIMRCLENSFRNTHEEGFFLFLTSGQEDSLFLHRHTCHDTVRLLHKFLTLLEERLCRFLFPDDQESDHHHISEHKWECSCRGKSDIHDPYKEEKEIQKKISNKGGDERPPVRHSRLDDRQPLPDARMERGGIIDKEKFARNLAIYTEHHRMPNNRRRRVPGMDEEEARRNNDRHDEWNRRHDKCLERRFRKRKIGNLGDGSR